VKKIPIRHGVIKHLKHYKKGSDITQKKEMNQLDRRLFEQASLIGQRGAWFVVVFKSDCLDGGIAGKLEEIQCMSEKISG